MSKGFGNGSLKSGNPKTPNDYQKLVRRASGGDKKAVKKVNKLLKKGDKFTEDNLKSIRPGNGLHTKHYWESLCE